MRKHWDPNQVDSRGSVIGGRFYNESKDFSESIASFFDYYDKNISFIKASLKQNPQLIEAGWFEKLTSWLGLPSFGLSKESYFLMQDYLDNHY